MHTKSLPKNYGSFSWRTITNFLASIIMFRYFPNWRVFDVTVLTTPIRILHLQGNIFASARPAILHQEACARNTAGVIFGVRSCYVFSPPLQWSFVSCRLESRVAYQEGRREARFRFLRDALVVTFRRLKNMVFGPTRQFSGGFIRT